MSPDQIVRHRELGVVGVVLAAARGGRGVGRAAVVSARLAGPGGENPGSTSGQFSVRRGGQCSASANSDGRFELSLSTPKELGGMGAPGANLEQLFAAGYSACFVGAMKFFAHRDSLSN